MPASTIGCDATGRRKIGLVRVYALCVALAALLMTTCSHDKSEPINVSVRDVVMDPYGVDGKYVRLVGYMQRRPNGDALYWLEHDMQRGVESHAVAVQLSPKSQKEFVSGALGSFEGVFEADGACGGGAFSGVLVNAHRVHVR